MDLSTFDAFSSRNYGLPGVTEADESQPMHLTWEEQQTWEKNQREKRAIDASAALTRAEAEAFARNAEQEWYQGEGLPMRQPSIDQSDQPAKRSPGLPPSLPPRISLEEANVQNHAKPFF